MRARPALATVFATALVAVPAVAQRTIEARRVTMPTKDAGTYHVATGTWTRDAGAGANLGPDVIYRADVPSGYFAVGWNGSIGVDEMVLPGTGNAKHAGPQDGYFIDGFTFDWCSLDPGPFASAFTFYDSYVPCDDPTNPANCIRQLGSALPIVLPAAGSCWTVTVDLTGSGYELCFMADGGPCAPGYQGGALGLDHGGWGWVNYALSSTGPLLNGYDPAWAPEGGGTCYDPNLHCFAGATGLGAEDHFGIGAPFSGCFWFGGYQNTNGCGGPFTGVGAQFRMVLYTDCAAGCQDDCFNTVVYCNANPDNAADLASPFCSCASGSWPLNLFNAPPNQFGYPIVGAGSGTVTDPPGAQGDLCLVGGTIGRYDKDARFTSVFGDASVDLLNALSGGGGGGIPNVGGNLCSPVGQTWNFQWWHRDGMNPSKFSKALTTTFQ